MKKYLIPIILFLCVSIVWAGMPQRKVIARRNISVGETCGAGSPELLFWWDATSTTITDGDGCSSGDTSATKYGDAAITAGKIVLTDGEDYYSLDVSSNDIFPIADFTIEITINLSTITDYGRIFSVNLDANDYMFLRIDTTSGNDLKLTRYNDSGEDVSVSFDVNLSTSTEYEIVVRCSTTDGPDLSINGGASFIEGNDVLTNFTDVSGTFNIGNLNAATLAGTIDDIKVYGGWKTY